MTPIFIHILSTGDVWASSDINFTPTGTILATYRVNALAKSQKIGTLSGNSGSYAASEKVLNKGSSGALGVWAHEGNIPTRAANRVQPSNSQRV